MSIKEKRMADKLKNIREKTLEMSQEQLAEYLGLNNKQAICNREKCKISYKTIEVLMICKLANIDPMNLI